MACPVRPVELSRWVLKEILARLDRLDLKGQPASRDRRAIRGSKDNLGLKDRMEPASGATKDRLEFKDPRASMVRSDPVDP
jgi:hypothetical protein